MNNFRVFRDFLASANFLYLSIFVFTLAIIFVTIIFSLPKSPKRIRKKSGWKVFELFLSTLSVLALFVAVNSYISSINQNHSSEKISKDNAIQSIHSTYYNNWYKYCYEKSTFRIKNVKNLSKLATFCNEMERQGKILSFIIPSVIDHELLKFKPYSIYNVFIEKFENTFVRYNKLNAKTSEAGSNNLNWQQISIVGLIFLTSLRIPRIVGEYFLDIDSEGSKTTSLKIPVSKSLSYYVNDPYPDDS